MQSAVMLPYAWRQSHDYTSGAYRPGIGACSPWYKKPSPNPDIALKSEPAYLFRRNGYLTNYRCTRLKFDVSAENKFL